MIKESTTAMTAEKTPTPETTERLFNDWISCIEQFAEYAKRIEEHEKECDEKELNDVLDNIKSIVNRILLIKDKTVLSLNDLAEKINATAHEHGWWDRPRSFGDVIALCHSELSEALEAYRKNEDMFYLKGEKPEGIAVELIDCIIRILDYLAEENIDIDGVMRVKMQYNKTREYRHGGKAL